MAHPIAPIEIDGQDFCCQDALGGRTVATVTGDASATGLSKWRLFFAQTTESPSGGGLAEAPAQLGGVAFGVCCASSVTILLTGNTEQYVSDGGKYDWVEVKLNGAVVAEYRAIQASGASPFDTEARSETVVVNLDIDRPCGNIIEITGATGDAIANNGVFWDAEVTNIT